MLWTIVVFLIAFMWLMCETDFLHQQMPMGKAKSKNYIECLTQMLDANWIEVEKYLTIKPVIPQLSISHMVNKILALPSPKQSSYFIPCDLDSPDICSKTIINIGVVKL